MRQVIINSSRKNHIYQGSKLIPKNGKKAPSPEAETELRKMVREATEAGMTYGKYVSLHHPRPEDQKTNTEGETS